MASSGVTGPLISGLSAGAAPSPERNYKLGAWTGDNFNSGHLLRNSDFPEFPKEAERTVDFVIVGGGIAGLTAAHYLRNEDFLLLEQNDKLGGQSVGGSYRGIDYSWGPAYISTLEGPFGELYDNLGIKPVTIPPTGNSWYWEKSWFPGVEGRDQAIIYKEFDRLFSELKPVWKKYPAGEIPIPLADSDLSKLDTVLFADYLKNYDPRFQSLMDSLCKSAFCGGPNILSALAGINYIEELLDSAYICKGGNPAVARALVRSIDEKGRHRMLTDTFVWHVDGKDRRASVVYSTGDGEIHLVNCKKVIVAAPPLVAGRIIPDLPDAIKEILFWFEYGSYLVANFLMPKKVFDGSYDNWVGSPFTFADLIVAETPYVKTGTYKEEMGSILTLYNPYPPASPGRSLLLAGDREKFASTLVDEMCKLVEQFQNNLEEVVLTRWGHAMVIAKPGFFARISKLHKLNPAGTVMLAHNSTEGLPAIESAILAARRASRWALAKQPF